MENMASARNKIATRVKAFIEGDGDTGIQAESVTLTAHDMSNITADVGAASLAASFAGEVGVSLSIGVALAENHIDNEVEAYIKDDSPPLVLCGHMHERKGVYNVGKTTIVNPGPLHRQDGSNYAVTDITDSDGVNKIEMHEGF